MGRSILVAQDQAASFLWGADIAHAVETGADDRDRSFELGRAVARGELGHACGAFDGDIGGDLTQQPTRDQHTASPVALGERRRQAQPKLLSLIVVVIDGRKLIGEQARRLFKTQASGDEKVGEQRVAQPVAIASAGALGAVRGEAAQADLAENVVVVHRDEPHIRPPGDTFIGVVARRDHATTATLRRSPHGAAAERRVGDQPLLLAPAVEAIEAGDSPVPACRRDPVIGLVAASLTMIGIDIVAGRSPHGLAAGIEKAEPDRNIIGVGAKRVPRADPRQRQVEKEAIQIGIIERVAAQD